MKRFILSVISIIIVCVSDFNSEACTSVIISSKITKNGKPLMLKHRDSDYMDNRVGWHKGEKYDFIALENSSSDNLEAWSGTNSAGFCIMNTASYNLKDDDVPYSQMDREGYLMYRALSVCGDLSDFEHFLDTLSRPVGVEANFGVIDAKGGAAYYEVNNHKWVKFDVDEEPSGYRVVTNFSFTGRPEDVLGYERYMSASDIFKTLISGAQGGAELSPSVILNNISRSYYNHYLGVDYAGEYDRMVRNGTVVEQDFIPRNSTSASIVFVGVKNGENPLHTVMWTILGYPATSVAIPLLVGKEDILPSYVKSSDTSRNALICDKSLVIKNKYLYPRTTSSGIRYLHIEPIVKGFEGRKPLLSLCVGAESEINANFAKIYDKWTEGKIGDDKFYKLYDELNPSFYSSYSNHFEEYLR